MSDNHASVSVRIESKKRVEHTAQRAHALRTGRRLDYVDYTRAHLNSVILAPPPVDEIVAECLALRQARPGMKRKPRSIRADGAVAVDGLLSFSLEALKIVEALSHDEQDRRFRLAAEAVADQLNARLVGLVVHRDEASLHAHFTLPAYDRDGRPLTKKTNQLACIAMQDVVADTAFMDIGIERGKSKEQRLEDGEDYSKTIHRNVRRLHDDLPREIAAAEAKVAALKKAMADVKLPRPTEVEVVTGRGALGLPRTEMRWLYTASAISNVVKDARAKQKLAEDKAAKAARDLEEQTRELERLQRVKQALEDAEQAWPRVAYAGGPYLDFDFLQALRTPIETRHGVMLQEQNDGQTVIAPPQIVSAKQIAAALYRAATEPGWEHIRVTASDGVAAVIRDLAHEDGVVHRLFFVRQGSDFKTRGPSLDPGTPSGQPEVDPVRPRSDSAPGAR